MKLKSLDCNITNQRLERTCVANIFMLCLLFTEVWSNANMQHRLLVRQFNNNETSANYEDLSKASSYHQPHFIENRSVVVQLFEWKFTDVAAECRDFLGPQGYAGVQLSPVLEHTVIKTAEIKHPWWERYEVVSYRLGSRSGDEAEFWSMSRICNEHGVRIYVDVVLNHMAAPLNSVRVTETDNEDFIVNTLLATNVNISQQQYSNVPYTHLDFHQPSCLTLDTGQDAHEIRNCQLNGHPDLDHSRSHVQRHIVQMLNKFVDMGVAGFRIDSAKYIWPIDLKNIFKQVKNVSTDFNFKKNSRPFVYHDVFDLGLDQISKTEYSTYGIVSEYLYPVELSTILSGKIALSSLINWGPALGFTPHEDSLVFIDSHDTQRGLPPNLGDKQMLSYKTRVKYIRANVFMLAHPYGAIKRIMSSYYFPDTDIDQGPPADQENDDEIGSPKFNAREQCTKESGWVCEHRWPEFVSMLKVANYFKAAANKEESIIFFQTHGANKVAFCRGYKAFIAINNDATMSFEKEIYACLEPGLYCDMVTGGKKDGKEECHGKILEINELRYMNLQLRAADDSAGEAVEVVSAANEREEDSVEIVSYGIVVIYVESKINKNKQYEGSPKKNEHDTTIEINEDDKHETADDQRYIEETVEENEFPPAESIDQLAENENTVEENVSVDRNKEANGEVFAEDEAGSRDESKEEGTLVLDEKNTITENEGVEGNMDDQLATHTEDTIVTVESSNEVEKASKDESKEERTLVLDEKNTSTGNEGVEGNMDDQLATHTEDTIVTVESSNEVEKVSKDESKEERTLVLDEKNTSTGNEGVEGNIDDQPATHTEETLVTVESSNEEDEASKEESKEDVSDLDKKNTSIENDEVKGNRDDANTEDIADNESGSKEESKEEGMLILDEENTSIEKKGVEENIEDQPAAHTEETPAIVESSNEVEKESEEENKEDVSDLNEKNTSTENEGVEGNTEDQPATHTEETPAIVESSNEVEKESEEENKEDVSDLNEKNTSTENEGVKGNIDDQPAENPNEDENIEEQHSDDFAENETQETSTVEQEISKEGDLKTDLSENDERISSDLEENQSRNLDKRVSEIEEQIEKPSTKIVDEINNAVEAADSVTAKIQDIKTAGFLADSERNDHNG